MEQADIINQATQILLLVLTLSLPPITVAAVTGVTVSLIQALTQIQDQTLSFALKLIAVGLTLYAVSGTIGSELYITTLRVFEQIKTI